MAIQFDIGKMDMFRNAKLANGDTIANLSDTGGIKANGQYTGRMSEANGVVTFTKDFMAHLAQILGNDVLKSGDFKVKHGEVTSGHPPTKRRIDAILTKAAMVGKTSFDLGVYRMKLDDALKFMENHLFLAHQIDDPDNPGRKKTVYGPKNEVVDHSFMRVNPVMDESRNQYRFEPVFDSKGNPVYCQLTIDEIDRIGKACLYNIAG